MENVSQATVFSIDGRGRTRCMRKWFTQQTLYLCLSWPNGSPTASVASMSVSNKEDVCSWPVWSKDLLSLRQTQMQPKLWMIRSELLRSCVRVEMDVLGSPSLEVPTVSVDVKQHLKNEVGDPLGHDEQKSAFAPLLPYHFNACPEMNARSVSWPLSLEYYLEYYLENWTALRGPTIN